MKRLQKPSSFTVIAACIIAVLAILFVCWQFGLFSKAKPKPLSQAQQQALQLKQLKAATKKLDNAYQSAISNKQYRKAANILTKVEQHKPIASNEFDLGTLYYKYLTKLPNHQQLAFKWFLKAANKGLATAESNVARMYFYGIGTEQSIAKASTWAHKALKGGYPGVTAAIGTCYLLGGTGCTPPNPAKAEKALTAAADFGDVKTQSLLSQLYVSGKDGFPKDPAKAVFWAKQAANKGNASAAFVLAIVYQTGAFNLPKNMKASMQLMTQAAKDNYGPAQATLAILYRYGLHDQVKKNPAKAKYWKQKAFANHAGATYNQLLAQIKTTTNDNSHAKQTN